MKVKITKARSRVHWYHEHIGEIFEIERTENSEYGSDAIHRIAGGKGRGIYAEDCEIYSDKEEFPTIKEKYFK